jgi:nucleoside-triphosphatase THEP1
MDQPQPNVVLWIGPKHSGKSTAAARLVARAVDEGLAVAGILAPAIYRDGALAGFDVVDIATGLRLPLARRTRNQQQDLGGFAFRPRGMRLGNAALRSAQARSAALVVVDEFGPLELRHEGWRHAVDRLIAHLRGTLLLVVRQELADDVAQLYCRWNPQRIWATDPDAIDAVLRMPRPAQTAPSCASR